MISLYGVSRGEASVLAAASHTTLLRRMTAISTLDPGAIIVPTCSASLKDVAKKMTVYILKCQTDIVALIQFKPKIAS